MSSKTTSNSRRKRSSCSRRSRFSGRISGRQIVLPRHMLARISPQGRTVELTVLFAIDGCFIILASVEN